MKILKYGLNSRIWFRDFERIFYSKLAPQLKPSYLNCFDVLGKSISFFIFEHEGIRNLCLFDLDDGSGLQEDSCKIKYDFLNKLLRKNQVKDYVIFKAQLNKQYPHYEFYPDISKTIPLGYFPENLKALLKYKKKINKTFYRKKIQNKEKIDILWIGTVNYDIGQGMNWPKKFSLKYWHYGERIAGFRALQEIAKERTDLNIICTDKKVKSKDYFDLISRSKICFDFPGVGEFTKRFIECLVLEKCVMSFKKSQELHFDLKENFHYLSIEIDDDIEYEYTKAPSNYPNSFSVNNLKITPKPSLFKKLNDYIDKNIKDLPLIEDIQQNISKIQELLKPDYIISYIQAKTLNYFFPD